MSSVLHPVGPERRATYWRRRLVAVLVLVVLLGALALGVRALLPQAPAGAAAARLDPARVSPTAVAATPSPEPTAGATADDTTDATAPATAAASTPAETGPCAGEALEVVLTTDAPTYGPGVTPRFALTVRNASDVPCTAEVGSGTRSFVVEDASGARVWSTDDCQEATSAQVRELEPEGTRSMTTAWSRQRSAAGCPEDQPAAGPGTYTVRATWGERSAEPVAISLAG
ncbi:hypothetical protein [Kineococcus gypseus]|uniref:hypothetical protein n=1 Tax=Kineococcus gypseus TaxID=1637102 RepID=UPI003D7CD5ED